MSEQVQHTQGPWNVGYGSGITGPLAAANVYLSMNGVKYEVIRKDDRLVAVVPHGEGDALEDARRIVAAVNAVEGIPTDALDAGVIRELLEVLDDIVRRLEWGGWDDMYRTHICPVCGAYRNKYKHYPNCTMATTVRLLQQIRGDADA